MPSFAATRFLQQVSKGASSRRTSVARQPCRAAGSNGNGSMDTVKGVMEKGSAAMKDMASKATSGGSGSHVRGAPSIENNTETLTDNAGVPILSNNYSLRAGGKGPMLLEDHHFLEKLGQFNREKIPERVVHARGMGARGTFEVTHDITHLTCADFLSQVGKKTEIISRLSTVTHEKGSPESLRDVRGFSVNFYTDQGLYSFVGNNIPVFFIRDGLQFPDLVHSLRPNPMNHVQEGWRALDFLAHHPESTNILTWLLGPEGIPENWRTIEGHSVNTFTLINSEGKERLCKMHFFPEGGAKYMTNEEAAAVGENNTRHSHATKDLFTEIGKGNFPVWTFSVQVLEDGDEEKLGGISPLDNTKEWPYDVIPLQEVGRLTLDRNVDNFNNDVEVAAYDPGRLVPGIGASDDPVLQSRIHSYSDTQRYRLGVNYQLLPVNQPRCPFHLNNNDGAMNVTYKREEVNYWPSMVEKTNERESNAYSLRKTPIEGVRVKADITDYAGTDLDFVQAGNRIRGFTSEQRGILLENLTSWMTDPKCTQKLRDVWYSHWSRCDASFGEELKKEVEGSKQPEGGHRVLAGAA